ncbi:hypothetical protein MIMGU_mgv1a021207mg, partial [Erythranthe guttata]
MDQLHLVAKAYYARATDEEKEKAENYFRSLDVNCTGKISLAEYKSLVNPYYASDAVFKWLDKNGDGSLDFEEVLALYFIHKIRPLRRCDACRGSLQGPYFSCLMCEKNHPNTYDICCGCYGNGKFEHHHPTTSFLDSYSMRRLQTQKLNSAQISLVDDAPE